MPHKLTDTLILKELNNYLAGKTSLQAFRRWFVPATWDIEEWAPAHLREVVYEIKLRLAEYSNGHWSKVDLRVKLLPLATSLERTSKSYSPKSGRLRLASGARTTASRTRAVKRSSGTRGKRKSAK